MNADTFYELIRKRRASPICKCGQPKTIKAKTCRGCFLKKKNLTISRYASIKKNKNRGRALHRSGWEAPPLSFGLVKIKKYR